MYHVLEGKIGNIRGAFIIFTLKEKGVLQAEKDKRKSDFIFSYFYPFL
jgi:hypothetical protein